MGAVALDRLPEGVVVEVKIKLHASGAMSVEGPMHDKPFLLAMLANAADAVRNHGKNGNLIVPAHDVDVGAQRV